MARDTDARGHSSAEPEHRTDLYVAVGLVAAVHLLGTSVNWPAAWAALHPLLAPLGLTQLPVTLAAAAAAAAWPGARFHRAPWALCF